MFPASWPTRDSAHNLGAQGRRATCGASTRFILSFLHANPLISNGSSPHDAEARMNRPDRRTIAATCVLVGLLAQIAHAIVPARPSDFDGNGASEIVVFRPSDGTWHRQSPYLTMTFGGAGDVPVPADYSGDGVTDVAVYRPSNMTWYVAFITTVQWGAAGDVPVPADYNGDGRTDFAVFRPSDGSWWVYLSGSGPDRNRLLGRRRRYSRARRLQRRWRGRYRRVTALQRHLVRARPR